MLRQRSGAFDGPIRRLDRCRGVASRLATVGIDARHEIRATRGVDQHPLSLIRLSAVDRQYGPRISELYVLVVGRGTTGRVDLSGAVVPLGETQQFAAEEISVEVGVLELFQPSQGSGVLTEAPLDPRPCELVRGHVTGIPIPAGVEQRVRQRSTQSGREGLERQRTKAADCLLARGPRRLLEQFHSPARVASFDEQLRGTKVVTILLCSLCCDTAEQRSGSWWDES